MRFSYSYTPAGLGVAGRFILALIILVVMKKINKGDPELDRGIRLLVFLGVAAMVVALLLAVLWFVLFGAAFRLPFIGHVYY